MLTVGIDSERTVCDLTVKLKDTRSSLNLKLDKTLIGNGKTLSIKTASDNSTVAATLDVYFITKEDVNCLITALEEVKEHL